MEKTNCWEHMQCGLHPGEKKASVSRTCPASVQTELNGIHGGKNAGRACWVIDDSLCPDIMREVSKKFEGCWKCDFYHRVKHEEWSSPDGFFSTYGEMEKALNKRNNK